MTFKVETFIDPEKAVNDTNIATTGELIDNDEFIMQPGRVFYYTQQAAKAERQVSTIKLQLEMAEAAADTRIREEARAAGEKLTADQVKALVRKDPQVTKWDVALIKAQEVLATIKGVVTALNHKKDMLIIRGNMTRDEIKARLSVESELEVSRQARHERVKERVASSANS